MRKGILILLSVTIVILIVGIFILTNSGDSTQDNPYELTRLPDSPLFASYKIEDKEVKLTDGIADGEEAGFVQGERMEVQDEPVYGDVNGDERDDAILLLAYTNSSSETDYYIALALKDDDGFLGVNALPLENGKKPESIQVRDEVIEVEYMDVVTNENEEAEESVSYKYFTLLGIFLNPIELSEGESVERGMYVYGHESRTFTPCNTDTTYWISPNSSSLAALQAIYTERTKGREPYSTIYIVLKGFETESSTDGFGADFAQSFNVSGILSVPKKGSCGL